MDVGMYSQTVSSFASFSLQMCNVQAYYGCSCVFCVCVCVCVCVCMQYPCMLYVLHVADLKFISHLFFPIKLWLSLAALCVINEEHADALSSGQWLGQDGQPQSKVK